MTGSGAEAVVDERAAAHACVTCGDVALAMRVLDLDAAERSLACCATVEGRREEVEIALVAPVAAGEWLLVHAGTAIARVEGAAA
jgi:hydrogenase maturation factor